jgi:superfamily II DNA or RNA helicase
VSPDYHLVLAPELTYTRRIQNGSSVAEYQTECLFILQDHELTVPAGMTARVIRTLRKHGVDVEVEDQRPVLLPEPVLENLDPLRPGQDEMIAAILANDCGIIEGPTGSGKSFLLRQMCKIWPDSRIIICSPFTDLVRQIYAELLELFSSESVGIVGAGHRESRRVVCAVDKSLGYCDLEKCRLFIFDEVHRAAAPCTAEALAKVRLARMFGFSATPKGRSDGTDKLTEAIFGPVIYKSSYQQVQATGAIVPVEVYVGDLSKLGAQNYQMPTALERNALWRNPERNQSVVDGVRWAFDTYGKEIQILVIVKTVEHLVHLAHLLPDFALCYGDMDAEKREMWGRWGLLDKSKHPITSRERARLQEDFASGKLRRAIATGSSNGVWSTGMDFPHLNVLVRADGQASVIQNTQIPGRVSRSAAGKSVGIIIDFDDAFNERLYKRAQIRLGVYRRKGWKIQTLPQLAMKS